MENEINWKPEKKWGVLLVLSIFLGYLGIDRFYAGDVPFGVIKLLTGGGLGIWWIIDIFRALAGKFEDLSGNRIVSRKAAMEEIEALKEMRGYYIANEDMSMELARKGYEVSKPSYKIGQYGACAEFYIGAGTTSSAASNVWVGNITVANYKGDLRPAESSLKYRNWQARDEYYYGIQIANLALLVSSNVESKEIPEFIEIAANVIKNSGCDIEHPQWLYEEEKARNYLNVMFQ